MKLNNRRTVFVGLAFLSISAFWQMYDNVVPLILGETFHLDESLTGMVMAADNILALFLLPFFGALSDRTRTPLGRRTPFILAGTGAVLLMNLLPLLDNSYAAAPSTGKLIAFVLVLGALLITMGTYRSPAVALMPDVTAKPLRSKANAIINLMGAVGGMLYLALAALLYPTAKTAGLSHVDYRPLFLLVSAIMVVAVAVLFLTIREPRLAAENQELEQAGTTARGARCCPGQSSGPLAFSWPPSPCGSPATTPSPPGLPATSAPSWARGWAGPPPACW